MRRSSRPYFVFAGILALFSGAVPVSAAYVPPPAAGFVVDQADVLSPAAEAVLEGELERYEASSTNELAVLTLRALPGDASLEETANAVFRAWGVGKEGKNNGVLFLVSVDDRKMRVEVGYGLEGDLTDLETKWVQDEVARPAFRSGDYEGGILATMQALEVAIDGEGATAVGTGAVPGLSDLTAILRDAQNGDDEGSFRLVLTLIGEVLLFILSVVPLSFSSIFFRDGVRSAWPLALLAWAAIGYGAYQLVSHPFVFVGAGFFGLLTVWLMRTAGVRGPGGGGSGFGGGFSGRSSRSSSSFGGSSHSSGGSSFGGGSSGGGGSSSSW